MKITKDEARIIAKIIYENKYDFKDIFDALEDLEDRLDSFGDDMRRRGRTTQNDFIDCKDRFKKRFKKNKITKSTEPPFVTGFEIMNKKFGN